MRDYNITHRRYKRQDRRSTSACLFVDFRYCKPAEDTSALTAAKEDLTEENADSDDKPHLEPIALKTFVKGLPDTLKPAITLSKPETLIEALQSVEQLGKFSLGTNSEADLYFTRPQEMSGPNPQPQNIRPNSPARQDHEKQGQRVKTIDDDDPNSYDRNSIPYNLNRDDMQLPPPLSINSQGGIDAHPNLRYVNNPSQPPSISKTTESRAPSPYQRPNSPASRPISPGKNYHQNQYNRNHETLKEKFPLTKEQSLIPEPPKCEINSFDSSLLNMEDLPYSEEEIISTEFPPQEGKEDSFTIPADSHKIIAIHTSHPNGDAYLPRIDIRPGAFIGDAAVKVTDGAPSVTLTALLVISCHGIAYAMAYAIPRQLIKQVLKSK
ncbi:hypothetical protein QAD02_007581 [Eretmocerus hayati]|uniref:Uncharacterized protein n=1 Tax=Eretmocerus hayati TaxID=131215 RepID=A0ACC2N3Z0_9HYME|nr:hypothetical protein QAD02_007581 [Eretmocerus hayati]